MLSCYKLTKTFGNQLVISSFSYNFNNTGFYLLYGESGSGKTTFLNILAGLIPFDEGRVNVFEHSFFDQVDQGLIASNYDYITQDTYFVDFLTVWDNLKMIVDDEGLIQKTLVRFGLELQAKQYPRTLSGGERQRLAIARSMIGGKKILFLDEPTASLDRDNKHKVFQVLSEIKNEVLIICSSHDTEARAYADNIIEFHKCNQLTDKEPTQSKKRKKKTCYRENSTKKKAPLICFLKQWFKSKQRNRLAEIKLGVFVTISLCLCLLADTPEHKVNANNEYTYRINMLVLDTAGKDAIGYNELKQMDSVVDVVLDYAGGVPETPVDREDYPSGLLPSEDYEMGIKALPFEPSVFRLANRIAYGSYFTSENQIILSAEEAERLMPGNHEKLIGQTVIKRFYEIGQVELQIVGIFDELNKFEEMYFSGMEIPTSGWYINSKFTEKYIDNVEFFMGKTSQRRYLLFFDSYNDVMSFMEENEESLKTQGAWIKTGIGLDHGPHKDAYILMFMFSLPLSIFLAFFAILFYLNVLKTEIAYNNHFISVFNYAGYPIKRVIRSFIALNVLRILVIGLFASICATAIVLAINALNLNYVWVEFQIFTVNIPILLAFISFLVVSAVIATNSFLKRLKYMNWYENLISQRDII